MVVVSERDDSAPRALATCVPITTAFRGTWYEVELGKKAFLREQSYANVQGIQAIQFHELQGPIGRLTTAEMANIRVALSKMLGLT